MDSFFHVKMVKGQSLGNDARHFPFALVQVETYDDAIT